MTRLFGCLVSVATEVVFVKMTGPCARAKSWMEIRFLRSQGLVKAGSRSSLVFVWIAAIPPWMQCEVSKVAIAAGIWKGKF